MVIEVLAWVQTALLFAILGVGILLLHRLQWLHDVFLPYLASLPDLIKRNGKGVG